MVSRDDFKVKRADGKRFEVAFSNWLQHNCNYFIIPTYDFTGANDDKAPRMTCGGKGLVLPDIWAARNGDLRWFEVKSKANADLYRKANRLVTGIPLRHWNDYQEVKRITRMPVYLVFIHDKEGKVVFEELDAAPFSHTYEGSVMSKGGMIFFDFDKLRTLMSVTELMRYAA